MLDVGPGGHPFPHATHLAELNVGGRHTGMSHLEAAGYQFRYVISAGSRTATGRLTSSIVCMCWSM